MPAGDTMCVSTQPNTQQSIHVTTRREGKREGKGMREGKREGKGKGEGMRECGCLGLWCLYKCKQSLLYLSHSERKRWTMIHTTCSVSPDTHYMQCV